MRSGILLLYLTLAVISLTHCDAERSMRPLKGPKHGRILTHKHTKKLRMTFKRFDLTSSLEFSNAVDSSSPLPPYESLAPIPLPQNSPPFCLYPPNPPSTGNPTPMAQNPPPSPPGSLPTPTPESIPNSPLQNPPIILPGPPGSLPTPTPESVPTSPLQNPPIILPGPPGSLPTPTPESVPTSPLQNPPIIIPSPPGNIPGSPEPIQNPPIILPGPPGSTTSPPSTFPSPSGGTVPGSPEPIQNPPIILPGPPGSATSPPSIVPSPSGGNVPSPIVFEPPVVFPPPTVPPPPYHNAPSGALWCVAKPSVPDPIIEEAMNYACGSGADCAPIQPNGPCFEPDTVFAHASFAFNSYWQNSKVAGGTCDFGGTGMLVSVDPSYDGCHFVYN